MSHLTPLPYRFSLLFSSSIIPQLWPFLYHPSPITTPYHPFIINPLLSPSIIASPLSQLPYILSSITPPQSLLLYRPSPITHPLLPLPYHPSRVSPYDSPPLLPSHIFPPQLPLPHYPSLISLPSRPFFMAAPLYFIPYRISPTSPTSSPLSYRLSSEDPPLSPLI